MGSLRPFIALRQGHGSHEKGSGHEGGEEGGQRDEEGSDEGPSHAEGHEEVQGVRGGMRVEQWGRFVKSLLPATHGGQPLWIHSAGCGQCFFEEGLVCPLQPACVYIVWLGLVWPPRRERLLGA